MKYKEIESPQNVIDLMHVLGHVGVAKMHKFLIEVYRNEDIDELLLQDALKAMYSCGSEQSVSTYSAIQVIKKSFVKEPTIRIAGYDVEDINQDSVKVGCQIVTRNEIVELLGHMNKS